MHPKLISEHAFDKLRLIDCTFAEFGAALEIAEVIEERDQGTDGLKELLVTVERQRPLHVVVVVDDVHEEERIVPVYEPDRAPLVPGLPSTMRCERCDQADRQPVHRAKVAGPDGRVAVVLGVPTEECPACGERWLTWEVATALDEILTAMLTLDVE